MEIFDWDVAATGNGFAAPDGFPEGMNYSDVNNAAREIMAVLARWYADTNGSLSTSGTGNAYTLTSNRTISSYTNGLEFTFTADRSNTAPTTLDVSGVGAASVINNDGSELIAGDLQASGRYTVRYSTGFSAWLLDKPVVVTVPTGTIIAYGIGAAPSGYLTCDGTAVSRTTYSALFGVVGTRYGAGDGSTTFNLPDLRGEFLRGLDGGAGNDPDAASRTDSGNGTTGDNVGTKQAGAFASHIHTSTVTTSRWGSGNGSGFGFGNDGQVKSITSPNTTATGGNETRPRNVSVLYCIKI